ncbi:SPOR domain-containing protein [Breznakiellaceae bacterium SP9]
MKKVCVIALSLGVLLCPLLYSQASSASSVVLAAEVQNIEKRLSAGHLSAAEKHTALIRLGKLLSLSNNIEKAVETWTEAAFADPRKRDDFALLEATAANISLGEYEKAEDGIKTVLLSGAKAAPEALLKARYLGALLEAFFRANARPLIVLASDAQFAEYVPQILYVLWKLSGDTAYKQQLLTKYPKSPEAGIAGERPHISAALSPMWLLFPGRSSETHLTRLPQMQTRIQPQTSTQQQTQDPLSGIVLQTGIFSNAQNAWVLEQKLKSLGFNAQVFPRMINGRELWMTAVLTENVNETIKALRDQGFDSFPLTISE